MAAPAPILVYDDAGADPFCVESLLRACRDAHGAAERINADALLAGGWQEPKRCAALAFPGGADLPYAQKLNGRGNAMIRDYVHDGGRYLGICAGAYYACRRIDFTGAELTVVEDRQLAFFPGTAVGPLASLAPPYRPNDLSCAEVIALSAEGEVINALYWGGCRFDPEPAADGVEVLARYPPPDGKDVACVRLAVGRGVAVLCGVHVEVTAADFHTHSKTLPPPADRNRLAAQVERLACDDHRRRTLFRGFLQALGL